MSAAPVDVLCVARQRARRQRGFKDLVKLWVDLFDEHELRNVLSIVGDVARRTRASVTG